jgi:hypothetical protein
VESTAVKKLVPREAEIIFHNALTNGEPVQVNDPDGFDFVVKLARQYARKVKAGVRTVRSDGQIIFTQKREYTNGA